MPRFIAGFTQILATDYESSRTLNARLQPDPPKNIS